MIGRVSRTLPAPILPPWPPSFAAAPARRRPNRKLKMFWAVTACAVVPTVISGVG